MTSRTSEVSTEAVDTGRLAVDVRDNIMALNKVVEELRESVIRVVRSSTASVDRQQSRRYPMDLPGRLSIAGGKEHVARVTDLSEGGALVQGARALPVGARGSLYIDGVARPLPCVVRSAEGDGLHLAFALDDAGSAALRPLLEQVGLRRAA